MRCRWRNSQASSHRRGTRNVSANRWEGSNSSAHSLCEDVVHAGVKKFLTEHTPSFVSSQKQTQKMLRGGSVMVKPLLWTFRAALLTLISSTCAEKKRSLPETLNHGPCNSDGKDCTLGARMLNATDEERSSALLLGVQKDMANNTTRNFKHSPTHSYAALLSKLSI